MFQSLTLARASAYFLAALFESGGTYSGRNVWPATEQITWAAMAWPMMAGEVPSTGITRVRMLSTTPNSCGAAFCSSVSGNSDTRGGSDE